MNGSPLPVCSIEIVEISDVTEIKMADQDAQRGPASRFHEHFLRAATTALR